MVSKMKATVVVALFLAATAAHAQKADNSLTVSWNGGGTNSGNRTFRNGSPKDRVVTTAPVQATTPFPTSVAVAATDSDAIKMNFSVDLSPRYLRVGSFQLVRRGSARWKDNPFLP